MTVSHLPDGSVIFTGARDTTLFDANNRQVSVQTHVPGGDATLKSFPFVLVDRVLIARDGAGDYALSLVLRTKARHRLWTGERRGEVMSTARALARLLQVPIEDVPTDLEDPFEAPTRRLDLDASTTEIPVPVPARPRGKLEGLRARPQKRARPPRLDTPGGPRSTGVPTFL